MATVDFTLDDIRKIVRDETGHVFDEKFKPAFDAAFEPHALAIQQDFIRVNERLDRLETQGDTVTRDIREIRADIKGIKRIVGQHSKEIIELKSRTA